MVYGYSNIYICIYILVVIFARLTLCLFRRLATRLSKLSDPGMVSHRKNETVDPIRAFPRWSNVLS